MVDYWHYRSVLYWSNVVRGKQTFCLDSRFFSTAGTVVGRDELVRFVKERIPAETLHELQTLSEVYKHRLDFKHPDLGKLLQLAEAGAINKYDAPILKPLADACCSGNGVAEGELQMISRLIGKYDVDGLSSRIVGT